jgi:hypothetical protein
VADGIAAQNDTGRPYPGQVREKVNGQNHHEKNVVWRLLHELACLSDQRGNGSGGSRELTRAATRSAAQMGSPSSASVRSTVRR